MPARDLSGLFSPDSICVIGASLDPDKMAARPLTLLRRHGFLGPVLAVNPRASTVTDEELADWERMGVRFAGSIDDLPSGEESIDLAVVNVAAPLVTGAVRDAVASGIDNFVVITAGFDETADGIERAEELRRLVGEHGLSVLGPNCEGFWNVRERTVLTVGSAADRARIDSGPVAVVTQSGSVGAAVVRNLQNRGIGCSYFVSVGNESDITALDCVEYIVERGESTTVLLYIEGFKDGHRLPEIARAARNAGVSLHVLRGGVSEAGRRATATHTGKVASETAIYSSVFDQLGVRVADGIDGLIDAGMVEHVVAPWRGSVARTPGVAVLTISGGAASLIVDRAARRHLDLVDLEPATMELLRAALPQRCVVQNPLDPVDTLESGEKVDGVPGSFAATVEALLDDPNVDVLLIQYANRGIQLLDQHGPYLGRQSAARGKPVVLSLLGDMIPDDQAARLAGAGVLAFGDPARAVDAASLLVARLTATAVVVDAPPPHVQFDREGLDGDDAGEVHDAAMRLLDAAGLRSPRSLRLDRDSAVPTWDGDFPVVLKVIAHEGAHKSELGWVRLGVADQGELEAGWRELAVSAPPGSSLLVQETAPSGVEVLVALRDDPDFGPIVAVGSGGSLIELIDDVRFMPAPATPEAVRRSLRGTRLESVLGGVRGKPAHDVAALVAGVSALSSVYASGLAELEIEFNPVIVHEGEGGATGVDALVVTASVEQPTREQE